MWYSESGYKKEALWCETILEACLSSWGRKQGASNCWGKHREVRKINSKKIRNVLAAKNVTLEPVIADACDARLYGLKKKKKSLLETDNVYFSLTTIAYTLRWSYTAV